MGLREGDVWAITLRKDEFLKSYAKAGKSLSRHIDGFLENPEARAVHDLRTAIRRIDAQLELLPSRIRKGHQARELLRAHRKVMKRTAKVRDLDVMRAKVSRYEEGFLSARLLKKIEKERRAFRKEAKRTVRSARKLSPPTVVSKDLPQGKLQKRFLKVAGALTERINSLLPVVAKDPDKIAELHRLRIDCKRMRYTIELAPKARSAKILALMEDWQDALGAIHDWDVTISHLQGFDNPVADELVLSGIRERAREFRAFASSVLNPA